MAEQLVIPEVQRGKEKQRVYAPRAKSHDIQPYLTIFALLVLGAFLCVTVAASLTASTAVGKVRQLWVLRYALSLGPIENDDLDLLARKANTIIGLSSVLDQARFWKVTAFFIVGGLITTAIVAGLAPVSVQVESQGGTQVSLDHIDTLSNEAGSSCLVWNDTKDSGSFSWELPDGSTLGINTTNQQPMCETQSAIPVLRSYSITLSPSRTPWQGSLSTASQ